MTKIIITTTYTSRHLVVVVLMVLTLLIYSESRSCRACLTALHSCTILSLLSSLVHDESAIRAAPLIILSKRSSNDGRERTSLYVRGSMITFCCEILTIHFSQNHYNLGSLLLTSTETIFKVSRYLRLVLNNLLNCIWSSKLNTILPVHP